MATSMKKRLSNASARARAVATDTRTGAIAGLVGGDFAANYAGKWEKQNEATSTFTVMGRQVPKMEVAGGLAALASAFLLKKPGQAMLRTAGTVIGASVMGASAGIRGYKAG